MIWIFTTVRDTHVCQQFALTKLPTWEEYKAKANVLMPEQSFHDMMAKLALLAQHGENPYAFVTNVYGFYVTGFRLGIQ